MIQYRVMVKTGHMLKGGTIVDAPIINAPVPRGTQRRLVIQRCTKQRRGMRGGLG